MQECTEEHSISLNHFQLSRIFANRLIMQYTELLIILLRNYLWMTN